MLGCGGYRSHGSWFGLAWLPVVCGTYYCLLSKNCNGLNSLFRPTEALASVISLAFVVYSHRKHSKYLGRELNHGPIASDLSFFLAIALVSWVFKAEFLIIMLIINIPSI